MTFLLDLPDELLVKIIEDIRSHNFIHSPLWTEWPIDEELNGAIQAVENETILDISRTCWRLHKIAVPILWRHVNLQYGVAQLEQFKLFLA